MEEERRNSRNGIQLDWNRLLGEEGGGSQDEPLQFELVVENPPPSAAVEKFDDDDKDQSRSNHEFRVLTDRELRERIASSKNTLRNTGAKLKDGGVKLKNLIKDCEDELERRSSLLVQKEDDDGCKKPTKVQRTNSFNIYNDFREGDPTTLPSSKSSKFATSFCSKMDRNERHTLKHSDSFKKIPWTRRGRNNRGNSSRETPVPSPGNLFVDVHQQTLSNGDKRDGHFASCSPRSPEEDLLGLSANKRLSTSCIRPLRNQLRYSKGEPVVLDDEDEIEVKEITPQADEVDECSNTSIYFPSRDEPDAVEICYTDMKCLAPEGYLTSTIMNFYIRYLQGLMFPTDRERHNYHFFNTYFYEKLKEAVTKKQSSMQTSFAKFRRWWKGVHIFEKAYILLPINEYSHWSLAIICIPDKNDRSGPIVLHLDSLGIHCSKSIFNNIKRFLIEEWEFLTEREVQLDRHMEDAIWERLPRRIQEKVLEVPQQRNEYDCGLFVLYFIKRFIEEAPERLKKNDPSNILSKFGKRWFSPVEASGLRQEISGILKQEFRDASRHLDP